MKVIDKLAYPQDYNCYYCKNYMQPKIYCWEIQNLCWPNEKKFLAQNKHRPLCEYYEDNR